MQPKLFSLIATALMATVAGSRATQGPRDPLSKLYVRAAKTKPMKRSSFRETERRRRQIAARWHPVVYRWDDVHARGCFGSS